MLKLKNSRCLFQNPVFLRKTNKTLISFDKLTSTTYSANYTANKNNHEWMKSSHWHKASLAKVKRKCYPTLGKRNTTIPTTKKYYFSLCVSITTSSDSQFSSSSSTLLQRLLKESRHIHAKTRDERREHGSQKKRRLGPTHYIHLFRANTICFVSQIGGHDFWYQISTLEITWNQYGW